MSRCIECWYTHGTHALACPRRYVTEQEASNMPEPDASPMVKLIWWIGAAVVIMAALALINAVV